MEWDIWFLNFSRYYLRLCCRAMAPPPLLGAYFQQVWLSRAGRPFAIFHTFLK
jgi:hypothetical protein